MTQVPTSSWVDLPIWNRVGLVLIALVAWVAYLPALHGEFLWDDDFHVPRPEMRSLDGLYRIWFDLGATQQYYPVTETAFWIEYQLWGDRWTGYHLVNLALHLAAAYLVYAVMRQLAIPGALLASALFALHPVQVESVAWITEQKNTLSAVCYLGSMLAYLRFDASRQRSTYALALALFLLALLSKSVTATLPAALLLIFWWQRGRLSWQRDVVPLLPFFALGAVLGLFTAWVERTHVGARGPEFALSIWDRLLLPGQVLCFYLKTLLWPVDLMFIYPRWTLDPAVWWQWLFSLGVLAVLGALWAWRSKSRSPLAAALFFAGTLFPVLGFLNVFFFRFSWVADHFQYLACLGIFALVAGLIGWTLSQLSREGRAVGTILCAAVVGGLALLTFWQSRIYANPIAHWQATIEKNPEAWMAYNNLGTALLNKGRQAEATEQFEQALKRKPDYEFALNNLGCILLAEGRPQEAIPHFQRAVDAKPDYTDAQNNLGEALLRSGRAEEAIEHYQLALAVKPDFAQGRYNLGTALLAVGRPSEAIPAFEEALRIKPDFAEAASNLGLAIAQTGRPQDALDQYERALGMNSGYAELWGNIALANVQLGRTEKAIEAAKKAVELARGQGNVALTAKLEQLLAMLGPAAETSDSSSAVPAPALPPPVP